MVDRLDTSLPSAPPQNMKDKLQVCVSGGRTSGYMANLLKDLASDQYDMVFTFSNTGLEHEDTLRFVNEVDKHFGLHLVWLEPVVHEGRVASPHKVVTYETAARDGSPFESVVAKYGLPNKIAKHCSRELKLNTMRSYIRSIGWLDATIAIGIRADERRRVSLNATKNRIIYPLVDLWPTTKDDVLAYFEQFDWDLRIKEHEGNCLTCFQKSDKKLNAIYRENPSYFDFFLKLEDLYSTVRPGTDSGPFKIFRGRRSTRALLAQFDLLNVDSSRMFSEDSGNCSESCEVFETEITDQAA